MLVQKLTGLLTGWQWEQGIGTADSDVAGVGRPERCWCCRDVNCTGRNEEQRSDAAQLPDVPRLMSD